MRDTPLTPLDRGELQYRQPPEFTAYELNELSKLARKDSYYQKAKDFVEEFTRDALEWRHMSERQQRWLWGIKKDIEDADDE